MKNRYYILMFAFILIAQGLSAQTFKSIDINTGSAGSLPYGMIDFNGQVYFRALGDTLTGSELWVSDGTQAGTHMVKDIWPGRGSANPTNFLAVGTQLFFTANDSAHGVELWVTDGTNAGTTMVSDINPGFSGSYPSMLTLYNGKVYFNANDAAHGYELWVSDGTSAGTSLVKDINPGAGNSSPFGFSGAAGYYIRQFSVINNKFYFRADDGSHGYELWSSDGTTLGTNMVADIWAGPGASYPYAMIAYNGSIIFTAADSLHGSELWTTDGTAAGTVLLKDINPGSTASSPADYSGYNLYNGKLYFSATTSASGYELWTTDGTSMGTTMVKDIWAGPGSSHAADYGIFVYNGKMYFNAKDSVNGSQLWTSDGTTAGTTLFKVLSSYTPFDSYPVAMINYNGQMVFMAGTDSINKVQLWTSDGTAAGTHIIAPAIAPNPNPLIYTYTYAPLCINNGVLYMNANFNSIGDELWTYSTPTGISATSGDHSISAYPNPFSRAISLSGLLSSETYTVQVYDMSGREFFSTVIEHPSDNVSLTMPELSTGVYLMRVSGQSSTETFRLVKSN